MPFLNPEKLKPKLREVFENVVVPQIIKAKMKQTAVEWFWLNLTDDVIGDLSPEKILKIHELIEQAKAMEKEQITEAYRKGYIHYHPQVDSEDYYNETFKSE